MILFDLSSNLGQNPLQLEEDKKRAEEDKVAAVMALELRSKEFMIEREEKKKLEVEFLYLMQNIKLCHPGKN